MPIRKVRFALQPESLLLTSSSSSLQSGLGSIHTVLILSLQVFFLTSVACQASSKYEGGRNLTPDPDLVINLVQGPREITDA